MMIAALMFILGISHAVASEQMREVASENRHGETFDTNDWTPLADILPGAYSAPKPGYFKSPLYVGKKNEKKILNAFIDSADGASDLLVTLEIQKIDANIFSGPAKLTYYAGSGVCTYFAKVEVRAYVEGLQIKTELPKWVQYRPYLDPQCIHGDYVTDTHPFLYVLRPSTMN